MRYKLACALTTATLGVGLFGVSSAGAEGAVNGQGNECHAYILQLSKDMASTNSLAATAAYFGVSVQAGQAVIRSDCTQP